MPARLGLGNIRAALLEMVWLLNSTELDNAHATTAASVLLSAAGRTDALPERRDLAIAAARAAIGHRDADGNLIAAGLLLVESLREGQRGVIIAGKHQLFSLSELADMACNHLIAALWAHVNALTRYDDRSAKAAALLAALQSSAPDHWVTAMLALAQAPELADEKAWAQFRRGNATGGAPTILIDVCRAAAYKHVQPPEADVLALLDRCQSPSGRARPVLAAQSWSRAQWGLHLHNSALAFAVADAVARDPWNWSLRTASAFGQPAMPPRAGLEFLGETIDATVDVASMPDRGWPGFDVREWFVVRWRGWVLFDGPTTIAVESDDGALLRIDGAGIAGIGGSHGMELSAAWIDVAPGWLRLSWIFSKATAVPAVVCCGARAISSPPFPPRT